MKIKLSFCLLLAGAFFLTSIFYKQQIQARQEYAAPPKGIEHFSFGHQNVFADSLWLRAIQDFDFCDEKKNGRDCRGKSWLFQVLDVASDLSPHFIQLYSSGALALSVIISDIPGASRMYDKGILEFPHDWRLLYKAAAHALFEEKDKAKAAHLMEEAAKYGAPDWVYDTATKLYTEAGQRELAERLFSELKEQSQFNPYLLETIRKRIANQVRDLSSEH